MIAGVGDVHVPHRIRGHPAGRVETGQCGGPVETARGRGSRKGAHRPGGEHHAAQDGVAGVAHKQRAGGARQTLRTGETGGKSCIVRVTGGGRTRNRGDHARRRNAAQAALVRHVHRSSIDCNCSRRVKAGGGTRPVCRPRVPGGTGKEGDVPNGVDFADRFVAGIQHVSVPDGIECDVGGPVETGG